MGIARSLPVDEIPPGVEGSHLQRDGPDTDVIIPSCDTRVDGLGSGEAVIDRFYATRYPIARALAGLHSSVLRFPRYLARTGERHHQMPVDVMDGTVSSGGLLTHKVQCTQSRQRHFSQKEVTADGLTGDTPSYQEPRQTVRAEDAASHEAAQSVGGSHIGASAWEKLNATGRVRW